MCENVGDELPSLSWASQTIAPEASLRCLCCIVSIILGEQGWKRVHEAKKQEEPFHK